ncbi:MAG TPA: type I DNA topoisomerase, partial [Thermotogales bacterium]|nr:type I DNA topoisomerase [Thermotogales bacterium]
MKKKVIIVESPAKAKTIQRFLGDSYIVLSSMGHVRDLPENEFGVNIDKGFKPIFRLIKGKKRIMDRIKEMVKKSDGVLLASDMDREGEAIAWHIAEILKLDKNQRNRIIFSEITEKVIKEAVKNPRTIDMRKVHAQIARRILDRIVGYKLSPLLWKIMKSGLSAGRVQSVALRFICEREEEIRKFIPKEFWRIFGIHDGKKVNLIEVDGKKFDPVKSLIDEEKANEIVEELKKKRFFVKNVEKKISQKKPPDPFITSTLQQEAANKLGFSVAKTMRIAQELYEGIDTPDGHLAFITYMRTDSTRVSEEAVKSAEKFIV